MAFVDRRLTLALDGREAFVLDLPPATKRKDVVRPVVLGGKGVRMVVRNFRLFRDVYYTRAGENALPGKAVRLGPEQYFVLGDNSPNSHDSRFWPEGGVVPAANVLGKPFLVHLPGRVLGSAGSSGAVQATDWSRVRWLP
jgi:signal peptidase I